MPPRRSKDFTGRLVSLESRLDGIDDEEDDADKQLSAILEEACEVARDAEECNAPNLQEVITEVDALLNKGILHGYGGDESDGLFDFLPSFAHKESTLVGDDASGLHIGHSIALSLLSLMERISKGPLPDDAKATLAAPKPWNKTTKPHPSTTLLARFCQDDPILPALETHPLATLIYQARCEVQDDSICSPIQVSLSSDGRCLALASAGGWKNRSPILAYWRLDGSDTEFPRCHSIEVGLTDVAWHSAMDVESKLMFVADNTRVKSFALAPGFVPGNNRPGLPVHTLDSSSFNGPLHVVDGRIFRAGKQSVGVWKIDKLATHGPDGTKRIGRKEIDVDSWRDDPEGIELSSGSPCSQETSFSDGTSTPWRWHAHPCIPGSMLCTSKPGITNSYSCTVLELETGRTSGRYLGHGAEVFGISTSEGNPHTFATACGDGYARLYDTRHYLPVLTFDVARLGGICPAVVMCHPDGIPTVFTGGDNTEVIKLWDVRACAAVYELATGNNSVVSLSWDSTYNSLFAATTCNYIDRLGNHHDYRRAKIPKFSGDVTQTFESHDDDEADDDDDDSEREWSSEDGSDEGDDEDGSDEGDDDIAWPSRAFHTENYFGYTFDAGDHQIYRYKFKANADTSIVPPYGAARVESSNGYW